MPLTAKISFRFLWRLALIAVICLGGSLYCLYDGAIGYPKQHDASVAYEELRATVDEEFKGKDKGLGTDEFWRRWRKIADEHGWSGEKTPKNDFDIAVQFAMAGCLAIPGLLYLYLFFRSRRRWIEWTGSGLRTSWGQQLAVDQITGLNKRKWKTKGIAVIRYQDGNRQRRMALDDWKYDTPATKAILCGVESKIDPAVITGGPPESTADAKPTASSE